MKPLLPTQSMRSDRIEYRAEIAAIVFMAKLFCLWS
jgi:hypothetical protein